MSPVAQHTRKVDVSRFAMVPRNDVPRSVFRTQATHKTTLNAGWLVPVYCDEVLPGDSFRVGAHGFARMSTPLFPTMDNMWLDWFWFFVPYRLLWDNFQAFMGERVSPTAPVDFVVPQVVSPVAGYPIGSVFDYFGLATVGQVEVASTVSTSVLPLRAYERIYQEWFRDENLVTPSAWPMSTGDGPDSQTLYGLRRRGKRHDYFTSCLPWPAKPIAPLDTDVVAGQGADLPPQPYFSRLDLGAPVSGFGVASSVVSGGPPAVFQTGQGHFSTAWAYGAEVSAMTGADSLWMRLDSGGFPEVRVLVDAIRQANMFQRLMERDARGGTRYTEIIRSHFGVISPDHRLQRPEYLGGGTQAVEIHPVAQQSASAGAAALGDLAATATSFGGSGFSQSFTEHGVVIGIVSIRADLTYQQGVRRFWFRRTKYDFFWPGLAELGEQAVHNREIYCVGTPTSGNDITVFGYQERWSEYKHVPSMITGRFRSTAAGTLDGWHLAQRFTAAPALNEAFINDTPPMARVLADGVTATDNSQEFLLDCLFDIQMVRPIPAFSVPGLGTRF